MKTTSNDHTTTLRSGVLRSWSATRAAMRTRLDESAARRQLRRELASYTTPAEIDEMLALVGDGDDRESANMRSILIGNLQRIA